MGRSNNWRHRTRVAGLRVAHVDRNTRRKSYGKNTSLACSNAVWRGDYHVRLFPSARMPGLGIMFRYPMKQYSFLRAIAYKQLRSAKSLSMGWRGMTLTMPVAQSQVIRRKCKASKPRARKTRRHGTTQINCQFVLYRSIATICAMQKSDR